MKISFVLSFVVFLSISLIAQSSVRLEEFVVLEKYCPGDDHAVVRVLDQEGDDEFKYYWKHSGDSSQIVKIYKADFDKNLCVERHCPCGSVYESCFVFDPSNYSVDKSEIESEDITCHGDDDGSATVYPSGNAPFSYLWNDGSRSSSVTDLAAGKYKVTVADALGCKQELTTKIKQPRKLKMRPKLISKNKMFAAVKLEIKGGTGEYYLNGQKAAKKFLFSTKNKKRYEFELEDENGCETTATIILRKKYKPKKSRAIFAKNPKKKRKHKGRMKCPKI